MIQEQRCDTDLSRYGGPGGQRQAPREEPESDRQGAGQQRHAGRGSHGELEPDRIHQRRVDREQDQHGGAEDGSGAPRPTQEDAQEGEAGHGGGAKDRRLGSGEQDEESDCPGSYREPDPAAQWRETEETHDGSEEHGEVLPGDGGQVGKPRRPEVCLDPGVEARGVSQGQAHQQARLTRGEHPPDGTAEGRPNTFRKPSHRIVGRTDPADPSCRQDRRIAATPEPGSEGAAWDGHRTFGSHPVAGSERRNGTMPFDPQGIGNPQGTSGPADPDDVRGDTRRPAEPAGVRRLLNGGHHPHRVTGRVCER